MKLLSWEEIDLLIDTDPIKLGHYADDVTREYARLVQELEDANEVSD
jgi:hypothetical protein